MTQPLPHWLLAFSSIIVAAAVSYHVFVRGNPDPAAAAAPLAEAVAAAPVTIDLEPLRKPIETLDQSLAKFSSTLQRFNTTIVQYDFLQKEMERLARLDQALGMRLNLEISKKDEKGEKADENQDEMIAQIRKIQEQVQAESERRRETMLKLITGLERELATSSLDEGAVREAIGDTPGAASPEPALPASAPPAPADKED